MTAPKFELRPMGGEEVYGMARVRIWDAFGLHPFDEGEVIGYSDQPTVIIRRADGSHKSWVASLPWELLDTPDGAA